MRQDENNWILDVPNTQNIFSLLEDRDLSKVSASCRFFRENANDIAIRRLRKYNISDNIISQFSPISLLQRVMIYHHETSPIKITPTENELRWNYGANFHPRYYENHIVRENVGVVAIFKKRNINELCFVFTYLQIDAYSEIKVLEPHQFLIWVNQSGIIEIQRLPNEKLEMLGDQIVVFDALSDHIFEVIDLLKNAFITKEMTSFPELAAHLLPILVQDISMENELKQVNEFYENLNRPSRSCCIA